MLLTNASNFWNDTYCLLFNRMQLAFTAWVVSLIRNDGWGEKHIGPVKIISLCHCLTLFPLVACR
jgi:hypothetical protein